MQAQAAMHCRERLRYLAKGVAEMASVTDPNTYCPTLDVTCHIKLVIRDGQFAQDERTTDPTAHFPTPCKLCDFLAKPSAI